MQGNGRAAEAPRASAVTNREIGRAACRRRFVAMAAVAVASALARTARAQQAGPITVTSPWTRAAGTGGQGAGYMILRNTGSAPDRLVAARTDAARAAELHSMVRDGDVMRMREVPAIELRPGQEVRLQPGGLHLMLIGLTGELRQGAEVPVTLVFERAGELRVMLAVQAAGARAPAHRH